MILMFLLHNTFEGILIIQKTSKRPPLHGGTIQARNIHWRELILRTCLCGKCHEKKNKKQTQSTVKPSDITTDERSKMTLKTRILENIQF
ncbi:Chloride channel protein [Trichinella spiralis]|uniref:Chloride channel protein n=1 Tax=Trichinella spiralis TaxID=6334 RepID=A0ABR3KBH3_TRISP